MNRDDDYGNFWHRKGKEQKTLDLPTDAGEGSPKSWVAIDTIL